ncbi:MAG TPA: hypothetical protein VNI34_03440 [Candidatus Nitrosotalea sp.]|nr:hypothetical protein [Candidatus Nitrosotalea sp.]
MHTLAAPASRLARVQRHRHRPQAGQGMVEYALILILVSIVGLVLIILVGGQLTNMLTNVTTALGA